MEILRDPVDTADLPRRGVVVVGNFDGVHRGHQVLLRGAVERARELGVPAVALTFEPHPERVLRPAEAPRLITTPAQRAQLLERLGLDALVEVGFTPRFAATPAEQFVREYLHRRLQATEVRIGTSFRFGTGRQGDLDFLAALGRELGFAVVGVPPVESDGDVVSSTRVRQEIVRGRVEEAWGLLGRPLFVDGRVYQGERMGRRLGFPTLNTEVENEILPAHGVYITVVHIPSFSNVFPSVTNIGVRPTIYENYKLTVESHVLHFAGDVYREPLRLFFLRRLRDEMVFASGMELVAQIRRDAAAADLHFLARGLPETELVRR
jgi:riboflavin kinase/FMN adenylyltransferase